MSAGIRTGLSRVLSTHFELLHVLSRYLDETGAAFWGRLPLLLRLGVESWSRTCMLVEDCGLGLGYA